MNRLLERQWQASTQLAQVGGILLGATIAAAAAILGGFRTLSTKSIPLDAVTGVVLVVSAALATDLASRSRDIAVGPKPESLGLAIIQKEDWLDYELLMTKISLHADNEGRRARASRELLYAGVLAVIGIVLLITVEALY